MANLNAIQGLLGVVVGIIHWLHARIARPLVEWWDETVLGTWEESLKSIIREAFQATNRFLNGISAWVLGVFDSDYRENLKKSWKQQQDWHSWWREDHASTLNAVIAQCPSAKVQGGSDGQTPAGTISTTDQQMPPSPHQPPNFTLWQRASTFVQLKLLRRRTGAALHDAKAAEAKRAYAAARDTHKKLVVSKSVLFEQPGAWGVHEGAVKRTGLLEDIRMFSELCVTRVFEFLRALVRLVTRVPRSTPSSPDKSAAPKPAPAKPKPYRPLKRCKSAAAGLASPKKGEQWPSPAVPAPSRLRRSHSTSRWETMPSMELIDDNEALELSSAAQIIKMAGYPLELHTVTTDDGYLLQMERIPRLGAPEVAFFMHGILDTSLTWVSSGVTGSQAFAAWDRGFDVWLGNSRSNPPRQTADPSRQGMKYWKYTINELGIYDMSAQVDHIHRVKCRELGGGNAPLDLSCLDPHLTHEVCTEATFAPGGQGGIDSKASLQKSLKPSSSDSHLNLMGLHVNVNFFRELLHGKHDAATANGSTAALETVGEKDTPPDQRGVQQMGRNVLSAASKLFHGAMKGRRSIDMPILRASHSQNTPNSDAQTGVAGLPKSQSHPQLSANGVNAPTQADVHPPEPGTPDVLEKPLPTSSAFGVKSAGGHHVEDSQAGEGGQPKGWYQRFSPFAVYASHHKPHGALETSGTAVAHDPHCAAHTEDGCGGSSIAPQPTMPDAIDAEDTPSLFSLLSQQHGQKATPPGSPRTNGATDGNVGLLGLPRLKAPFSGLLSGRRSHSTAPGSATASSAAMHTAQSRDTSDDVVMDQQHHQAVEGHPTAGTSTRADSNTSANQLKHSSSSSSSGSSSSSTGADTLTAAASEISHSLAAAASAVATGAAAAASAVAAGASAASTAISATATAMQSSLVAAVHSHLPIHSAQSTPKAQQQQDQQPLAPPPPPAEEQQRLPDAAADGQSDSGSTQQSNATVEAAAKHVDILAACDIDMDNLLQDAVVGSSSGSSQGRDGTFRGTCPAGELPTVSLNEAGVVAVADSKGKSYHTAKDARKSDSDDSVAATAAAASREVGDNDDVGDGTANPKADIAGTGGGGSMFFDCTAADAAQADADDADADEEEYDESNFMSVSTSARTTSDDSASDMAPAAPSDMGAASMSDMGVSDLGAATSMSDMGTRASMSDIQSSGSLRRSFSSQAMFTLLKDATLNRASSNGSSTVGPLSSDIGVRQHQLLLLPGGSSTQGQRTGSSPAVLQGAAVGGMGVGAITSEGGDNSDASTAMADLCNRSAPPGFDPTQATPRRSTSAAVSSAAGSSATASKEPYNLRVVAHSLGGASMLIYLVMRCKANQPHHVRRLILLTPAGFHKIIPWAFWPICWTLPWVIRIMRLIFGKEAAGALYLPTFIARLLAFKFTLDTNRIPALAELIRRFMGGALGGDKSSWERAIQMPHYNARAMPALSIHQGLHMVQLAATKKFQLYDYGSHDANMSHYGTSTPPDIGSEYWRIDVPIDLSGGIHDGIIPLINVRTHRDNFQEQGVKYTYKEFEYGHMDFTFMTKDELRYYVMDKLLPPKKNKFL